MLTLVYISRHASSSSSLLVVVLLLSLLFTREKKELRLPTLVYYCVSFQFSLLMGNLFIKEAAELILVDTISLIIWSNYFRLNTLITCKSKNIKILILLSQYCLSKYLIILITCNRARFTWEKVEDLKMEHCYIAQDYFSEVRLFQVMCITFLLPFSFKSLTINYSLFYDRKGTRKQKIKPGVGSFHGFHHQLRSLLQKKRLQERQP